MASTSPSHEFPGRSSTANLADLMVRGKLSLAAALRYGTEIAHILHQLHQQDRTHGMVVAANVLLGPSGVELLPEPGCAGRGNPERDVRAFGALLYEMVTRRKVPADVSAASFRSVGTASGADRIRAAAIRLAGNCLGYLPVNLSMQQAATELRLLWVVARQLETSGAREPQALPFVVHTPPAAGVSGASPLVPLGPEHFSKPAMPLVDLVPAGGACPKCDSTAVFLSRPRSWFERCLARWKFPLCRCHGCYHRYVVAAGLRISKDMPEGIERRFKPMPRK